MPELDSVRRPQETGASAGPRTNEHGDNASHAVRADKSAHVASRNVPRLLIIAALLYWGFQIVWFWRYCGHNINADAVSYIGIARHITDGNLRVSLHGYWSPLISWLIAATARFSEDRTLSARLLMLPLFALSMALVFVLTEKLWGSRFLSAFAVLWFTAARGVAAFSVYFIGADLLLTVTTLLYFILLLECLKHPQELPRWLGLGTVHALAFLAKAIAMPLFACTTLVAVAWSTGGNQRQMFRTLIASAMLPVLVWAGWGMALRTKYGAFTTGYQLRWNLIDPASRKAYEPGEGLAVLRATDRTYDAYMVSEVMPPGSGFWNVKILQRSVLGQRLHKESQNIPQSCKELLVLLTPGGLLALMVCLWRLVRHRANNVIRFRFVMIALLGTSALVATYDMLVFDGRYVIPIAPVLISLSVGFGVPLDTKDLQNSESMPIRSQRWQLALAGLIAVGLIGVQFYWASPFRTIRQDYQTSVYEAAGLMKNAGTHTVVNIGEGPYPEHGVGWEAGVYSAYFSGSHIIAGLPTLPTDLSLGPLISDVSKLSPDGIMVWGMQSDSGFSMLVRRLRETLPACDSVPISDPHKGEVGTLFLCGHRPENAASTTRN